MVLSLHKRELNLWPAVEDVEQDDGCRRQMLHTLQLKMLFSVTFFNHLYSHVLLTSLTLTQPSQKDFGLFLFVPFFFFVCASCEHKS